MVFTPRGKKIAWPNPELSVGAKSRDRVEGYHAWDPVGPVKDAYEQGLSADIKSYLEDHSESISYPGTFCIFMIGQTPQTSVPTILFICPKKPPREAAQKLIKKSGILKSYPGFKTGHRHIAPGFDQLVEVASSKQIPDITNSPHELGALVDLPSNRLSNRVPRPAITWSPTQHSRRHDINSSNVGRRICISNDSAKGREATIGGVVQIGQRSYYMTAAHAFRQPITFLDEDLTEDDKVGGLDFDSESGSEDEFVVEDITMTSRGSQTPELANSEHGSAYTDGEDEHLRHGSSSEGADANISHLTTRVGNAHRDSGETTVVAHQVDNAPVGLLFITSFSGDRKELDYALIRVQNDRRLTFRSGQRNTNRFNHQNKIYAIRGIVKNGPFEKRVVAAGLSNERYMHGRVSSTSSYLRLPNSKRFQEMYTVHFDGSLEIGDCGAWVIDATTGDLFGHIVLGDPTCGTAYIVPVRDVFDDVEKLVGERVQLPLDAKEILIVILLMGIGSQFYPPSSTKANRSYLAPKFCPYHAKISDGSQELAAGRGLAPMERWLHEGPGEQQALFVRLDNGKLSTHRDCRCVGDSE